MRRKQAVAWLAMAGLVALLVVMAPQLRADSEPPSGAFVKEAPAVPAAVSQDPNAGLLDPGTVVEPMVLEQPAAVEGAQGGTSGLADEPAAAQGQAALEQAPADLEAAGLEAP